jgi:hypothetical protein
MNTPAHLRTWSLAASLVLFMGMAGCEPDLPGPEKPASDSAKGPEAKKVLVGKNVWCEVQGKKVTRVVISAQVCLREGPLEQLLTRKEKKEHEAPLSADVDARDIHKALLLTGAEPGATVKFQPKYTLPSGQRIKVTLEYEEKGKKHSVPGQDWVRDQKTGKTLDTDWVFAGSQLVENPFDPKAAKMYLANDGDVICVSNFEGALLDLPINSPNQDAERNWEANTESIPPKGTPVVIILEPIPNKEKK